MLPALMHASQVARPLHAKKWVYEEKVNGFALTDKGRVRLVSRDALPHLVEALAKLKSARSWAVCVLPRSVPPKSPR